LDTRVVFPAGNLACGVIFVLGIANVAKEELIETVRSAFNAVNGAIGSADFALGENSTVTRRADAGLVIFLRNVSSIRLECSGKEVSKCSVLFKSVTLCLFNFDTIDGGEKAEKWSAEARQNWDLANVASETALKPGDGDNKAVLFKLFEKLVAEYNVAEESE